MVATFHLQYIAIIEFVFLFLQKLIISSYIIIQIAIEFLITILSLARVLAIYDDNISIMIKGAIFIRQQFLHYSSKFVLVVDYMN